MEDVQSVADTVKYRQLSKIENIVEMYAVCSYCGEIFINDIGPVSRYCPNGCRYSGYPAILQNCLTISEAERLRSNSHAVKVQQGF